MADAPADLVYFAFDLLHLDGEDLIAAAAARTQGASENAADAMRRRRSASASHVIGNGARDLRGSGQARPRRHRLEAGRSGPTCRAIAACGSRPSVSTARNSSSSAGPIRKASRSSIGSLLLGYYRDDGKLIYAGRAGTGMTESELRALLKKLRPLASDKMTVDVPPPKTSRFGKPLVLSRVHWVRPEAGRRGHVI